MLHMWQCGCVSVGYIVHCMFGCAAVSLTCWALGLYGCQSDMLGFGGHVAVSLICWALVAMWLSV